MTSNINNAAMMSLADYFGTNQYKGKIYKTNNMLGKTLAQEVGGDSIKLTKEQQRIDKEISTFESQIWGDQAKRTPWILLPNLTRSCYMPRKRVRV